MATAEQLGPGGSRDDGKPIFIATDPKRFSPSTDRELSDQEQLAWKSFQLWRATLAIERRDSVYKVVTNADYTNFNIGFHLLGTPYPVVESVPTIRNVLANIRWYEHGISAATAYWYFTWLWSKASTRRYNLMSDTRRFFSIGTFALMEICFAYRSLFRLQGYISNDHECRKYGVLEDRERLERKKVMWAKYAAYKKEWCRRFDYHVFGIRPGENLSLFSACWIPAVEPSYGKITDYQPRKNPYSLSAKPLGDLFTDQPFAEYITKKDNVPIIKARPELKYLYHGPLDAGRPVQRDSSAVAG